MRVYKREKFYTGYSCVENIVSKNNACANEKSNISKELMVVWLSI